MPMPPQRYNDPHRVSRPRANHRPSSPKCSTIRQTALHHPRTLTALIWQQMRPEFRPAHVMPPAPCTTRLMSRSPSYVFVVTPAPAVLVSTFPSASNDCAVEVMVVPP